LAIWITCGMLKKIKKQEGKMEEHFLTERVVTIKGEQTGKKCPPGFDYCWECGHIAPVEEFEGRDKCPNPDCPHPENWND